MAPPDAPQEPLFHGPGAFSGLQLWRPRTSSVAVKQLAARLLEATGQRALVAVDAGLSPSFLPMAGSGFRFPSTQAGLLVQVAAETREALLELLRRASATCAPVCYLDEELLGGRIGEGREPFGFRDGLRAPTREEVERLAVVRDGSSHEGGSFLLYVRFEQSLERFGRLSPRAQESVMGLSREGTPIPDAPPTAHVPRAKRYGEFVRRGFPYRSHGQEGLAFVAASNRPERLRRALEAMLGRFDAEPERLLAYAEPLSGGCYFAPARSL